MENLEKLSDQELRLRLNQYGFPNLPVTDTTRKVLIKKLKNAIEGQTVKNRRETVAVTKFSSDEEPEEKSARRSKTPNRRATVAVAEKTNGATNGRAETPTRPPSRRSAARQTPAKDKQPAPVEILQEDSDEDIIEVPVRRRSRTNTPTLGKSETVRTSYKNSKAVVEDNESEEFDEPPPPRQPSPVFTTTTRRKTFTTARTVEEKPATPTQFGRKTMTTSYNPRNTNTYESMEIGDEDTPYLSSFAKRLSTLRAEPLDPGMEKYKSWKENVNPSSKGYNYQTTAKPRGFIHGLRQAFDFLDRKYNLRNILYIILIVMIIVAIYVIFL